MSTTSYEQSGFILDGTLSSIGNGAAPGFAGMQVFPLALQIIEGARPSQCIVHQRAHDAYSTSTQQSGKPYKPCGIYSEV